MIVLGIDPGNARLGYGLVEYDEATAQPKIISCGVVETSKGQCESLRLAEIRRDLDHIFEVYKPDLVSIEKLFFFKNPKTVMPVAQARGVALEIAGTRSLPVFEYTPLQVKQTITGQGRAEKSLVLSLVKKEFDLKEDIKPDDAVDALAIALTYIRMDYSISSSLASAS